LQEGHRGVHGGPSFTVTEIGADPKDDVDPLLDVQTLHAPEAPCIVSRQVPEFLLPRDEMIARFEGESQVLTQDCGQRLAGVVDLPGNPPDLVEPALQDPFKSDHDITRT
jgi:hypothetical protein